MLTLEEARRVVSARTAVGLTHGSPVGRDAEFARGRESAKAALTLLGIDVDEIPVGPQGAPVWPEGFVGSISHTADVAIAAAAQTVDLAAIGIDIEHQDRRLDARTMRRICTPLELGFLAEQEPDGLMPLILFCAKEATYKALGGFVPRLGWHDVDFRPDGADYLTGELSARAAMHAPIANVSARVLVAGGFVVVCVEVPATTTVSQKSLIPSAREGTAPAAPGSH